MYYVYLLKENQFLINLFFMKFLFTECEESIEERINVAYFKKNYAFIPNKKIFNRYRKRYNKDK